MIRILTGHLIALLSLCISPSIYQGKWWPFDLEDAKEMVIFIMKNKRDLVMHNLCIIQLNQSDEEQFTIDLY